MGSVLVNFDCQRDTLELSEKGVSTDFFKDKIVLWACLWNIAFIINWCLRDQDTVRSTLPWACGPGQI